MGGIAGIIHWGSEPPCPDGIEGMLEAIRHRGPDGLWAATRRNVALGHARFLLRTAERNKTQPVWLPDGSAGLVADARLYNRAELLRTLGAVSWLRDLPSDAELLLAAFERWGERCVARLRGDFAFAVWDEAKGRLFAARDPFGVKPFFYHENGTAIRFASEPKALLPFLGAAAKPHDGVIADYLVRGVPRAFEETFLQGIHRLRAGHVLVATNQFSRQNRYWPQEGGPPDFHGSPAECAEQFYSLFRESVRRRLETDFQAALHLSGGYDSSSVVLAAADLYKTQALPAPLPLTVCNTYPGFACDESAYSAAVVAQAGFEHLNVPSPCDDFTPGLLREFRKVDAPTAEIAWRGREALASILRNRGVKTLLTGLGGDELIWDPDYELDLWHSGRYLDALLYCLNDPRVLLSEHSSKAHLKRLLRQGVPPEIRSFLRRGRKRREEIPDWLNTRLVKEHRFFIDREPFGEAKPAFPDLARSEIFRWLSEPAFLAVLEQGERLSAYMGVELHHPFLDQDLVAFVLSIPFETRLRLPGPFKTLLTAALGNRLPEKVRQRGSKASFNDYCLALLVTGRRGLLSQVSSQASLASERYVMPEIAIEEWSRPISSDLSWYGSGRSVWQPLFLEIWLQDLPDLVSSFSSFNAVPGVCDPNQRFAETAREEER